MRIAFPARRAHHTGRVARATLATVLSTAFGLAALGALSAPAAAAVDIPAEASAAAAPQRLSGLWLMDIAPAERADGVSAYHMCIGGNGDEVLAFPGSALSNCSDAHWLKTRHYLYYRASCDAPGGRTAVSARFSGDFQYNYQGELYLNQGSAAPVRIELDGRRLGPCKGGLPTGKFLIEGRDGVGRINVGEGLVGKR